MGKLTLVSAGAGSGKTYDLCQTVAEQVVGGLDPARLLATTFTRKAAAELKGRVQIRILEEHSLSSTERIERAERLEQAVMGTVHSVAHQLLSRYAVEMGLSPRLEVLDEQAEGRCLDALMNSSDPELWIELARLCDRLSLDTPHAIVADLIAEKRSNRIADNTFTTQMEQSADGLCEVMSSGVAGEAPGFDALYDLARETLRCMDGVEDITVATKGVRSKLVSLVAGSRRVWKDFESAAALTPGKNSRECLEDIVTEAARVLRDPVLHRDVREVSSLLAAQTVRMEREYHVYKQERGLLDYTDLEVLLLRLLEDERLARDLRQDFDLVVVDEFQDTNPLQLAIYLQLRALAGESRWVGDPKQSIYGFRGADPELVHSAWERVADGDRRRQEFNYRSRKGLVELAGKLFEPVFGKDACLKPKRTEGQAVVERWILKPAPRKRNVDRELAAGVALLHEEGVPLHDIAVLTRTNNRARAVGGALGALGIPSLLELPGLLSTRECALTLAGMRLVADRKDSLAAATVMHIISNPEAETPAWLDERIRQVVASKESGEYQVPWRGSPVLEPLEAIDHRSLTPSVAVRRVVAALDVPQMLREWGDPPRRLAHLDALLAQAAAYEEMQGVGKAATLTGLIAHLESLADDGEDTRLPPHGLEAVTVLTYHKAKGLEWPVVVVTDLDNPKDPDLFRTVTRGGDPGGDRPLEGRELRHWPWPFGSGMYGRRGKGAGLADLAQNSDEGLEAGQREDREAIRLLYVGITRARDRLVLAHSKGHPWFDMLPGLDSVLSPDVDEGRHDLAGVDAEYVLRHIDASVADNLEKERAPTEPWLDDVRTTAASPPADRYHNPSDQAPGAAKVHQEELEGGSLPLGHTIADRTGDLGNAVHAYMAALPSVERLERVAKETVARRCLDGFGVSDVLAPDALVTAGERFQAWIHGKYPDARWLVEVPVTAPRVEAGQWNGQVDLLLLLPDDSCVVIDHKGYPIQRGLCAKKAGTYEGQLRAYRKTLIAQPLVVRATWVHFPVAGMMVEVTSDDAV